MPLTVSPSLPPRHHSAPPSPLTPLETTQMCSCQAVIGTIGLPCPSTSATHPLPLTETTRYHPNMLRLSSAQND